MTTIKQLEKEIMLIKERNKKVEMDKLWETSFQRKFLILFLTYFVFVVFFIIAKLPMPFINAIIPSLAYIISTSTLSLFKKLWKKS